MTIKDFYTNLFLNFVCKYSPELIEKARKVSSNPRQLIRTHIKQHLDYGTITPYYEDGELVGLCNYDITDVTAHIKNCVVHPNYRHRDILKKIIRRGLQTWPFLQYIEFERSYKKDLRSRKILISRILKTEHQGVLQNGIR